MDRFDRGVLALVGACFVATAIFTGIIWYDGVGIDLIPYFWPAVFAAAGITTIGWAAMPENYVLFRTSGILAITSLVARAVNSIYVGFDTYKPHGDRIAFAHAGIRLMLFLMLSVLVSYTWSVVWERFAWVEKDARRRDQ